MTGFLLYWLDPRTGSSSASTNETFLNWDVSITCPGPNITLLYTDLIQHYDETLDDYVIDQPIIWSLWKASGLKPLRLTPRDDGLGINQHPRIDSVKNNNWSSAIRSLRIFNQGSGTYR